MNQVEKVRECELEDGRAVAAGEPVYIRQGLDVKTSILQTVPIVQVAHGRNGEWFLLTKNGDLLDPTECWSSRETAEKSLEYDLHREYEKWERQLFQIKQALKNLAERKENNA